MQTLCKLHGSAGIAHMDVKPENILLAHAEDNAWNRLRLIDFGLSAKSVTTAYLTPPNFSKITTQATCQLLAGSKTSVTLRLPVNLYLVLSHP